MIQRRDAGMGVLVYKNILCLLERLEGLLQYP